MNHLLARLPAAARRRLLARSERVILSPASVLQEPGSGNHHVFFPISGFVAVLAAGRGGPRLEVGLVGNEGMLGTTLILGDLPQAVQWLVLGAGEALRVEAGAFIAELAATPALRSVLNRYLLVTLAQLVQSSACNRFHVIESRLARWLLMTRDRAQGNKLHITHETLALLMGVRRAGITRAASSLQSRKLIRYTRGDLRIVDGQGLESASCDCYSIDNNLYEEAISPRPYGGAAGGRTPS
jgi:CRP-like cAMP-binding protein